jgi:hypothetical protein
MNNDDCIEITNPEEDNQSKKMGSTKRKRGRPRKLAKDTNSAVKQFSTEAITDHVEKKQCRKPKPGPHQKSTYTKP